MTEIGEHVGTSEEDKDKKDGDSVGEYDG